MFLNAHSSGKLVVTCPCGELFLAPQVRVDDGRGKHCSRPCAHKYKKRHEASVYTNSTTLQPGHAGWSGPDNPKWKGDEAGYAAIHAWLYRHKQRPEKCEWCGDGGIIDWASISHEYLRNLDDWAALCRKCHRNHDSGENRGRAVALFGPDLGRRLECESS
jgi:hypothetical protein